MTKPYSMLRAKMKPAARKRAAKKTKALKIVIPAKAGIQINEPGYRIESGMTRYKPVSHDHGTFLKDARKRAGFRKAYDALKEEYRLIRETLTARSKSNE